MDTSALLSAWGHSKNDQVQYHVQIGVGRLAHRLCSCKQFWTVPELILLSPGMVPEVTVAG